jgi:hypothetical protein
MPRIKNKASRKPRPSPATALYGPKGPKGPADYGRRPGKAPQRKVKSKPPTFDQSI